MQDELSATVFGAEEEPQGGDSSERRKSSHRAVLEKKLSIAERAVATNPCSITLQLERLRICQELWEPSLLAKEWKKLVSPQFFQLTILKRCCIIFLRQRDMWEGKFKKKKTYLISLFLMHSRCSSTQTALPCGGNICCSLKATSATSLCPK